jgi:hypothetical protein
MCTSGRHGYLLPEGLSSQPSVRNANLIGARTAALAEIAMILDQEVLVEQPDKPRGLISLPRWQSLAVRHKLYRTRVKQGAYEADTEKPTALFSNHTKWCVLSNTLSDSDKQRLKNNPKELVSRKRDENGVLKLTGKREALKSTQAYTPAFGRAVVSAWASSVKCVSWRRA